MLVTKPAFLSWIPEAYKMERELASTRCSHTAYVEVRSQLVGPRD